MALVELSFILFVASILVAFHCPFYRDTQKGITTFHWVVCNWLSSTTWLHFRFLNYKDDLLFSRLSSELLLGIATLLLIIVGTWNRYSGDVLKNASERFMFILTILLIDCGILILSKTSFMNNYIILSIIFFSCLQLFSTKTIRSIRDWDFLRLRKMDHESFFVDYRFPVNCLGRFGYLNFSCVLLRLLTLLVPKLRDIEIFVYAVYICSALSTFLMFCLPAHLGGLIQVFKVQFRYWTGQNLEADLSNQMDEFEKNNSTSHHLL